MKSALRSAVRDIVDGARAYPIWLRLGLQETRRRYRRTMLGPFWMTLSLGLFIAVAGFVWSFLWRVDAEGFMPYLASGMITWVALSTIILEACGCLTSSENIIHQVKFPYSMLAYALVWRNLITFFHNAAIFLITVLIFHVEVNLKTLLVAPALILFAINGVWVALLFGLLCARFRDIEQIVKSVVQVAIFVTPIFWMPSRMPEQFRFSITLNPLHHFIELVRAPMLGQAIDSSVWAGVIVGTIAGWGLTLIVFARFRTRIPYWV